MIRLMMLVCIAALFLCGCPKKQEKPVDEPTAPAAKAEPTGEPAKATAVDEEQLNAMDVQTEVIPETKVAADQIPTPEDFEQEAAKKITAANLESELDALEQELGK